MPRKEPFDVCRGSCARSGVRTEKARSLVRFAREGGNAEGGGGRGRPSGRPPFEEMGALNVKKWSAAASVAESEDLMDCSMSHVEEKEGGKGARGPKAAGKTREGEVEWVS